MPRLILSQELCDAMFDEARASFPKEACGVIVGERERADTWRFLRFDNLQDKMHALDPATYSRDARVAYYMHPLKLNRLVEQVREAGQDLLAIVHSHPGYPSYFSVTDQKAAAPMGTPTFPEAAQLVVSVYAGEVKDLKAFVWDGAGWPERELGGVPELPGPPEGAAIFEE